MPDEIPEAAIRAGAEALLHQYEEIEADYTLTADAFTDEARAVLKAALPHIDAGLADAPAVTCPWCHRRIALTADGTLSVHARSLQRCPGSDMAPGGDYA